MNKTSAQRPRIAFRDLTEEGKLNALRKWQNDYFTGSEEADYAHLGLEEWQALVMAHWMAQDALQFMDDNSGRM